jgi:UDP-N-acetylglucosamine transferase subunit ALG13
MLDKVVNLYLTDDLLHYLEFLIYHLGTGGIKQTFTCLSAMVVFNKLSSLAKLEDEHFRQFLFKKAKKKGMQYIAVSFKGNEQSKSIFYRAKTKLEKIFGKNLNDTTTLRLLLLLAFYDEELGGKKFGKEHLKL